VDVRARRQSRRLKAVEPVPTALARLAHARDLEDKAVAAHAAALQAAESAPDPRDRRQATRSLDDLRGAVLDARAAVASAERGVAAARTQAYARVAPCLTAEHARVLEDARRARAGGTAAACEALVCCRGRRRNFLLAGAGTMPARSAIAGEVGSLMLARVRHWARRRAAGAPAVRGGMSDHSRTGTDVGGGAGRIGALGPGSHVPGSLINRPPQLISEDSMQQARVIRRELEDDPAGPPVTCSRPASLTACHQ